MNRKYLLAGATALLLLGNIAWYYYANWGLVTIHAKGQPLSQIILSIERQGHVTIKTNLDPATKVSMYVTKVPVTLALESLSANTDASWRLAYVIAGKKDDLATAISSFESGRQPDGWKVYFAPLRQFLTGDGAAAPPDPRRNVWTVTAPPETTLQSYLDEASLNGNIAFFIPENWNPQVKSQPTTGRISKVIPKLAGANGGVMQEFFALQSPLRMARPAAATQPDDDNARAQRLARSQQAAQVQINNLPTDQRAAAQAQLDADRKFADSLRNLSVAERLAKALEHYNNPDFQAQQQQRQDQHDAITSPDQKVQHYQNYINRRSEATAAGQ